MGDFFPTEKADEIRAILQPVFDAGAHGRVLLPMMLNAAHAVSGRLAREVRITTGVEGDRTFLRVADTGCGIASDARERLFLPFFSTKGEHAQQDSPQSGIRGTGLGLAVCQTIAHAHDGVIEVESEPERGAVFTLFLPRRVAGH